jgi:hypothetical protein
MLGSIISNGRKGATVGVKRDSSSFLHQIPSRNAG